MKKLQVQRVPKSVPAPASPISSKLTLAELSLQRGEFIQAREILKTRIAQGSDDFRTLNLFAITSANLRKFEEANLSFKNLQEATTTKANRAKATFNLGLSCFLQDLARTGDLTVAAYQTPGRPSGAMPPLTASPFQPAIDIWEQLLKGRPQHQDIVLTFLSFAYLQAGNLDRSIESLIDALSIHENFYVMHYVLGRLFLDLYFLADEGSDYMLNREAMEFFEIETYEVTRQHKERFALQKDTFLDIALQAFLEGRGINPMCPEILIWLCHTYLLAGIPEDAEEILGQIETLAQDSLATLEISLRFHELMQSPPDTIRGLVAKIETLMRKEPDQRAVHVIPPYFLT